MNKSENLNDNKKKEIFCSNCGKKGHTYKFCSIPITSLGIICFEFKDINLNYLLNRTKKLIDNYLQYDEFIKIKNKLVNIDDDYLNNNIKYIIVRRKNSLSIVEFLRGKYNLNDLDYLKSTFSLMTISERNSINDNDFDFLWNNLWTINSDNVLHKNEYENAKTKFNNLKNGININISEIPFFITLELILNSTTSKWLEPEWGFPKGRRNLKEKDLSCATREFNEETNFNYDDYQLLTLDKIIETYMGTNNIKYKHIYYIAQKTNDKKPKININNLSQYSEIGDIKLVNYNNALKLIREYNLEKKNVLTNLHSLLKLILGTSKDLFIKYEEKYNNNKYKQKKM